MDFPRTRQEVYDLRAKLKRPTIWREFQRPTKNGNIREFVIQDVTDEDREQCLSLVHPFLKDEPISKVLGVPNDETSVSEIIGNWREFFSENLTIVCYEITEMGRSLVGFNNLILCSKEDEPEDIEKYKGVPYKKLLKTLIAAEETCSVFEKYDVDVYLSCSGMVVLPEYRGMNIGVEILAARESIAKSLKLRATVSTFTAAASQICAQKAGFETLGYITYESMKMYGIDFSGIETPSAKLMGKKYD